MSIEQNPDQRHRRDDIAETTPDLKALHARPAVIPGKEHRDDKGSGLGKKIGIAVGGLALVGAGFFGAKVAGNGDHAPTPDRKPVATSSPNPSETKPTQAETSDFTPTELSVEKYQDGDALIRAF